MSQPMHHKPARMLHTVAQTIYYGGHLVVRQSLFSVSVGKKIFLEIYSVPEDPVSSIVIVRNWL